MINAVFVSQKSHTALFQALLGDNITLAMFLIANGADINTTDHVSRKGIRESSERCTPIKSTVLIFFNNRKETRSYCGRL
jgi:hypothetical protein